jgi:hypothetical protein
MVDKNMNRKLKWQDSSEEACAEKDRHGRI